MVRRKTRSGLILLVVLGMLALLSLLSVTFLVFSAESRKASFQLARSDYRGTPPDKLIDQAVHQVIRGTTDSRSPIWLNDILGDLYGESTSEPFQVYEARATGGTVARDNPLRPAYNMPPALTTYDAASPESPRLYGEHLLKIPLAWPSIAPTAVRLPEQHDALNGRVVTFMQGPLEGQSFRILRYMGEVETIPGTPPTLDPTHAANQYSIVIDLSEIRDRVTSKKYGTRMITRSVADWISLSRTRNCLDLLFDNVAGSAPNYTFTNPYNFVISAGVTNSNGLGVDLAGTLSPTPLTPTPGSPPTPSDYAGLIPDAYLINHARTRADQGGGYTPAGDTDEAYDAADFQNAFLAMRQADPAVPITGSDASDRIVPSFHRPATINYLISMAPDLSTITSSNANQMKKKLIDFIELVRRATGRPLSIFIKDMNGAGAHYSINSSFTGSNQSDNRTGFGFRTPQLTLDWNNIAAEMPKFQAWLRWLTRGPWDVDNDGDLINDSIWMDMNFPLVTSSEGKLLKILAAFYIEDMDGKLDLNAAGSLEQADDTNFNPGRANGGANNKYAYLRNYTATAANTHWPQGLGYGPADISLRPLFDAPTAGTPPTASVAYSNYLNYRYGSNNGADINPGSPGVDDAVSMLNDRYFSSAGITSYRAHNPAASTVNGYAANCFPFSVRGRAGIALDLLGNPIFFEDAGAFNETVDDPYDGAILRDRYSDRSITVSDWERLARFNDVDRSALPSVLQKISNTTLTPGAAGYLSRIRSVSPRNVNLNLPRFAGEYEYARYAPGSPPAPQNVTRRVASFVEFVEAYAQAKFTSNTARPIFTTAQLRQLFPIEFRQNMPLNLNRPLGNGSDDDNNGVIDEADELRFGQLARFPNNQNSTVSEEYSRAGASFDPDLEAEVTPPAPAVDPKTQFNGNQPKQFLARHLYCLAQLILPDTYVFANDTTPSTMSTLTPAEKIARRARALAQWAVNVVDFRDPDSAMTRFAYDATPFDGSGWVPTDGVVFGVEAPELLLTESFAMHDMRIRRKPGSSPPVREQLRIPEGSLFLEFFCPRTTIPAALRGTVDGTIPPAMAGLYDFDSTTATGTLKLNLGAVTPVNATNPVAFPVWRVVMTKPVASGTGFKDRLTQVYETAADRFNYTYQFDGSTAAPPTASSRVPWFLNGGSPTIPEPEIDRILWFTGVAPTTANAGWTDASAADKIYYGYAGSNYLAGGQYLVVGPRDITYFGSRDQGPGPRDNQPSHQRIQIANNTAADWVQFWDMNNDPLFWKTPAPPKIAANAPATVPNWTVSGNVRNCVTLIAGMQKPTSWTDPTHATSMIGLNISEPTRNDYYREPDEYVNDSNSTRDNDTNADGFRNLPKDGYINTNTNAGTSRPPFDRDSTPHAYLQNAGWPVGADPDRPSIRTEQDWSAAVLQRLADPLRAWDPKYNPYITVDWLPIDLTVFSGEEQFTADGSIFLATRRKTGALMHPNATTATNSGSTFYSYNNATSSVAATATGHASQPFFDYELQTEYICKSPAITAATRDPMASFATLGYLNPQFTIRGTVGGPPTGTDDYTYANDDRYLAAPGPNITNGLNVPMAPYFPNRDFVNVVELTSVPISSPSSLMQDFGIETAPLPASDGLPQFTHTLDFEDLRTPAPASPPGPLNEKRTTGILLELLATKSPWPDASKVENPVNVVVSGYAVGTATAEEHAKQSLFEPFRAPMNLLPSYREPGKINLNTMTEDTVFRGLMWNAMTPTSTASASWYTALTEKLTSTSMPYWTEFQKLRRGFDIGTNASIPNANPYQSVSYPFEFSHPFTTATAFDKLTLGPTQYDRATNAGLLRRGETTTAPYDMATSSSPKPRLFKADVDNIYPDGATAGNVPLNTYIRNYPAARLANLTTDRSSVFAIRVTLGYFEADSGGNLGSEYGADQGKAKRHRAIYMIDRSIPVGYQPGQDLNTDNIILLRRMIE